MNRTHLTSLGALAALWFQAGASLAAAQPQRRDPVLPPPQHHAISLDGVWQVAEGKMDQPPAAFDHTVPVPGLVSLATPPFADPPGPKVADRRQVPQKDPKRDAFWYRRVFRLDEPLPAVAVLKVRKAMFGTRVILNGQLLGDHLPSFTPGYFNARSALKVAKAAVETGENELLIRVGADRDAVGPAFPSGFDFEKERYIPGIFDSVELILSGTPHFTELQVEPAIPIASVRVQAVLRNDGPAAHGPVTFVVREARTGYEAGRWTIPDLSIPEGGQATPGVLIPIAHCRLWSPEDPFLYTLDADNGTDHYQTRFGMREFKLDPATGRAVLNGRPYFMRGSNFTLYRFFEDSECKDLPWRPDWVRLLHQRVKEMHWNCLRYCIGFPPEAWYDAADEAGILIQDEFPLWYGGSGWSTWPKELKSDELAREYAEWMRERWNHPSVVIWDASNETASPETDPAIRQVRGLDLSRRPWDNSYMTPMEPGDVFESHPYHFNPKFRLTDLAAADPVPQGNQLRNDGNHAVVINEYGWHWVNRDGTPTTLTRDIYRAILGENATAAQRFHVQATWLAADTEFWRLHRKAAAVIHFTMLGYSRPDGQTCDHWKLGGVESLEWEPEFYRYVRDAFAPVGLALDFWKGKITPASQSSVPVVLLNDLDQPWSGPVALRLRRAGEPAALLEYQREANLEPLGLTRLNFQLSWPETPGQYTLEAELRGSDGQPVRSTRELEITPPSPQSQPQAAVSPASAPKPGPGSLFLFVATNGNDHWSGTLPAPKPDGTDGPYATPARALTAARALKPQGAAERQVTVWFRAGSYFLDQPLVLKPEDSGLVLAAYPGESPVLSGGRPITGWRARSLDGKPLWAAALPAARDGKWLFRELWVNGRRALRARHPANGYLAVAELPDRASNWAQGNRRFRFHAGDLKAWNTVTNAEVVVMTKWVESRLPILEVDENERLVRFAKRSVFALEPGDLYYAEGALDFLDQPGEWCLDSTAGTLYYWPLPGESLEHVQAVAPVLAQVLRFEGRPQAGQWLEDIQVKGLTFSHTEWCFPQGFSAGEHAPVIDPAPAADVGGFGQAEVGVPGAVWGCGVRRCAFEDCSFSNLGDYGLELGRGCTRNRVVRCEFAGLGAGGIKLGETAIRAHPADQSGANLISGCRIHDGGLMFHSAIGIWLGQSPNNVLTHNLIHDFYYTGISIGWTWGYGEALATNNTVQFNHIHHIGVKSNGDGPILSDMGGIYTLGKQPGTTVINNLWHDIAGLRYGGWGIYFDEGSSGILAESNLVYRTTHGGFHQHYGETNLVRNNVFAFARDHQLQRTRPEDHISFSFQTNIVYFDSGVLLGGDWSNDHYPMDWNLYFDARPGAQPGSLPIGPCSLEQWRQRGHDLHSLIADPLFQAPKNDDFRLQPGSPALQLGFHPLDLTRVGPQGQ